MKKMNLFKLTARELDLEKMRAIRAGELQGDCADGADCGCLYQGEPGGSSTEDNRDANAAGGLGTPGFDIYDGFWSTECNYGQE